jgi:putative spermidine/putrescine transport system substrate-binding protein
MTSIGPTRRSVLVGMTATAATAGTARAQLPTAPVALNIVDAAGNLQLTQHGFEAYRKERPKLVSTISFTQAPAPEIPGKMKAQEAAGRVDIDMLLIGNDALSAGIEQNLLVPLLTEYKAQLPDLDTILTPQAKKLSTAAHGQGVIVVQCPGGPIFEYMPDKVPQVPATAADLMAWCKQNPKRFMYARPANSGPGRAFMMGLPYILGDSDPRDPVKGWNKTWAYLAELATTIEYYPSGTAAVFKEFGDGSRDIVASHVGWDLNPRILGIVPKEADIFTLEGFHWIGDSHFMAVPKGLSAEKMAVLCDLMTFMLQPAQQALTYDKGYFYPGPAVKDVPLSMAPQDSQDAINEYGRAKYAALIADTPMELPLEPAQLIQAFRRWDQQIGSIVAK